MTNVSPVGFRPFKSPVTVSLVVAFLLFTTTCLAGYWPGVHFPFLFDSVPAISANPSLVIYGGAVDEWYAAAFSSSAGPSGRPVAMLSFALNAFLSGSDDAFAFRLTNLAIHITNSLLTAILVCFLARRFIDEAPERSPFLCNPISVGILAGAIFLLHTLQFTAVVHDVQRMVLLATTFQLSAVFVYLRGRAAWAVSGAGRVRACNDLTWIVLFCLLGFFSKESALLTPLLLLVAEAFWFSSRPRTVLVVAFAIPVLGLTAWVLNGGDDVLRKMYNARSFDLGDRLLTQTRVLWIYLYWFFWPAALTAGWNHDDITVSHSLTDPWVLAALGGWALTFFLVVFSAERKGGLKLAGFAVAWFLVSHLMESTVVPLEMAFEHRNYGAILGLVMAVSVLIMRTADMLPRTIGAAVPLLVMLTLWGLLFMRALAWENPLSLGVFSVAERPGSVRSKSDLAEATFNRALQTNDKSLAVVARDSFESLAADAPGEALPLARLIEIESILRDDQRLDSAVTHLVEALGKPRLSTQDWIGIGLVEQCAVTRQCIGKAATERILSSLSRRTDADHAGITLMRARIALGASGNPRDALDRFRGGPTVTAYSPTQLTEIAIWHGMAGERAAALEAIRAAIASDHKRLRTAEFRRLYAVPTPGRT